MAEVKALPARMEEEPLDYRLEKNGWVYAVKQMPDPKCKRTNCYGRGFTGTNVVNDQPIPCKCVGRWRLLHEPMGGGEEDGPPGLASNGDINYNLPPRGVSMGKPPEGLRNWDCSYDGHEDPDNSGMCIHCGAVLDG